MNSMYSAYKKLARLSDTILLAYCWAQTLTLWNINPRHWLNAYFKACAKNKGKAPDDISPFIPWEMNE